MTDLKARAAASLARITEQVERNPPAEKLVPRLRVEIARLEAEIEALKQHAPDALREAHDALSELVAMVRGECPSLLDEYSGGSAGLDLKIDRILTAFKGERP